MNATQNRRTLLAAVLALAFALCVAFGILFLLPKTPAAAAEEEHTDHSGWTAVSDVSQISGDGNYYLETDVTGNIRVSGTVTLCLNGHMLTGTGEGSVITVQSGADVTLCDCNGTQSTHYYTVDESTGFYNFAGVTADTAGAQAIEGGVITGGDTGQGGGIYLNGLSATPTAVHMYGGTIAGNYASSTGGGVVVANYATFTLYGGTIAGNEAYDSGGGVYVGANGKFVLEGGALSGNSAYYTGGGVLIDGAFEINGGEISGNSASSGGGIAVYGGLSEGNGVATIVGGSISNNNADYGGGIYAFAADIAISGGSINNNTAGVSGGGIYFVGDWEYGDNDYTLAISADAAIYSNQATEKGGGIVVDYAKADIIGGEIYENTATEDGGGLYANYCSEIYINGGKIYENTATENGGGIFVYDESAIMIEGGEIYENTATEDGGGVYIMSSAATISGGSIYGNSAESGGGIYLDGDSLTLEGGTIYENSAENGGGGVYTAHGSEFAMTSGKIINNSVNENYYGGGLYAAGAIEMSGFPVITGNTAGSIANDLEINRTIGNRIVVTGAFTNGANIGIIDQQGRSMTEFTSGYSSYNTADPATYFFADDGAYAVQLSADGEVEVVQAIYTVIYVGLDGTETSVTLDMGEDLTLNTVTARAGYIGGWTIHENGTQIVYDGGRIISGGLGSRHGEVIYLYAVQERDLGTDIDAVAADLAEAVAAVNEALAGAEAEDLAAALTNLIDAYKAADSALAGEIAGDLSALEDVLRAADEALDSAITAVQENLDAAVEDLEGSIAALEEAVAEKADAAALTQAISDLTAAYQAADERINADIADLEGAIGGLEDLLGDAQAALQESIDALESAYQEADEAIWDAIEQLQNAVADLNGRLGDQQGTVEDLQGLIDELQNAVADLSSQLGDQQGTVEDLQGLIDELQELVGDQQTQLDGDAQTIRTLIITFSVVMGVIALLSIAGFVLALRKGKRS